MSHWWFSIPTCTIPVLRCCESLGAASDSGNPLKHSGMGTDWDRGGYSCPGRLQCPGYCHCPFAEGHVAHTGACTPKDVTRPDWTHCAHAGPCWWLSLWQWELPAEEGPGSLLPHARGAPCPQVTLWEGTATAGALGAEGQCGASHNPGRGSTTSCKGQAGRRHNPEGAFAMLHLEAVEEQAVSVP